MIDSSLSVDRSRGEFMRKLMALAAVVGAVAGAGAGGATPAAAYHDCIPSGYYYARGCCPRYYGPVSYYQPILRRAVRTIAYDQVVGYRHPRVRYWRPCCR